jgi:hypothetical protein
MADLAELWRIHQNAPFPASCLPLSVDGMKLVKLDAAAGALLTASLRTDGVPRRLEDSKRGELQRLTLLILKAVRELPLDPEAKAYFERLAMFADRVVFLTE